MEERTIKEIAKRFINFCDRLMKIYVKNYELFLIAEKKENNYLIAYYKTETTIYQFSYDWEWEIFYSEKVYLTEKKELINGHKIYDYMRERGKNFFSNYISGLKTWEEKYQEIIKE